MARTKIIIGAVVAVILGLLVWVAYSKVHAQSDLIRQLRGDLTAKEREFEAQNTALGLAQSKIVTQGALNAQYEGLLKGKDADLQKLTGELNDFRKKYDAKVDSITRATFNVRETDHGGTSIIHSTTTGPTTAPVQYEYWDTYKRFHLIDPDIFHPGQATLAINQHFKLTAIILQQNGGNLKAQQVLLEELAPDGKTIGMANLDSATFNYAPPMAQPNRWFDPHLIAEIGTTFMGDHPLNLGLGATLLHWKDLNLGAVGFTDFRSLSGSGLAAQLFYRPTIKGTQLNLALGAGMAVDLDLSIRPYVGITFVIW